MECRERMKETFRCGRHGHGQKLEIAFNGLYLVFSLVDINLKNIQEDELQRRF